MIVINKQTVGKLGEDIASKYLVKLGWKIISQNFQKRYTEIDIIAKDKNTLVFVEVKTRKGDSFGPIEESITPWKIRILKKSVDYYLHLQPSYPETMRVDFVGIELLQNDQVGKISHYKNITG